MVADHRQDKESRAKESEVEGSRCGPCRCACSVKVGALHTFVFILTACNEDLMDADGGCSSLLVSKGTHLSYFLHPLPARVEHQDQEARADSCHSAS